MLVNVALHHDELVCVVDRVHVVLELLHRCRVLRLDALRHVVSINAEHQAHRLVVVRVVEAANTKAVVHVLLFSASRCLDDRLDTLCHACCTRDAVIEFTKNDSSR